MWKKIFHKYFTHFALISLIVYCNCESITELSTNYDVESIDDLVNCPDPDHINYLETNETLTRYIDYRPGCSRQWVLRRQGFTNLTLEDNQLIVINSGALLIITHLDLDVTVGDYLLIADGVPNETYHPSIQVITSNILDESKTINIQSLITWIGLVNGPKIRSTIGLIFTWVPPELIVAEESIPSELRSASIDLCFEKVECSIIAQWKQLIRFDLTQKINNYLTNQDNLFSGDNQVIDPIDQRQLKIIRNESRIADEKTSQYKFCRVQIAVTSQIDINWAHSQLTKSLLSTIWFSNHSDQLIVLNDNQIINYIQCEDESFDPLIVVISLSIFVASLIASLGLWRWNHLYLQSIKQTIKPTIKSQQRGQVIQSDENVKHNPIYESEDEDDDQVDYVIGGKNN